MRHALAIDIGGSKLMMATVSKDGKLVCSNKKDISKITDAEILLDMITEMANKLLLNCQLNINTCGIAIPGLVDSEKGEWVFAPFSGISNFPIAEKLGKRLKMDVYIDNDVNLCALAEKEVGKCKDVDNFFWMTISNGIGGALFINNKLYKGTYSNAGEIGHITVVKDGIKCGCGGRGCLEKYASGAAIADSYFKKTGIHKTAKEVATLAKEGDDFCLEIYKKAGKYIGYALSGVANLMNVEKIIIGGGVSLDYDIFHEAMLDEFNKHVFKKANEEVVIEKTDLDYYAAIIGAGILAIK